VMRCYHGSRSGRLPMRRCAVAAGFTVSASVAHVRKWPVLDSLTYDDSEPPSIALVPPGTSWEEVHDHIKIAHDFLLVQPGDGGYAGAYWTGTEMVVLGDLGTDLDEALDEFREQLSQRGEL
jgi:hypothetical protein